jgi:SAM-dependent methyltransferase
MIRSCPACGGHGSKKYSSNIAEDKFTSTTYSSRKSPELMHHALFQCDSCSSLFVGVLPNFDELIQNYVGASFDSQVESEFAARTYCKYLEKLNLIRAKKVLDIGCGDGSFIKLALASGASAIQGIEPSGGALSSAGEMKRSIRADSIEVCDYDAEFDLATCFQTLEHLLRPDEIVLKMCEAVVPGGFIAVVCHDRLSLVNRVLGRKSPIFDIEHLQMFSGLGLESLIRNAGLEIVYSKQIVNRYPLGYWLRLSPLPRRLKNFIERNRRFLILGFPISLMVGNRLVVAKKLN